MSKKRVVLFLFGVTALFVGSECTVRLMGLVDFPIYTADAEIGYQLAPSQSGSFLNKNDWFFNEKSMGVQQRFEPKINKDVLLVGDSIVLGGNPLSQEKKLGPRLTQKTGRMFWPVAAGSWSMRNELAYLARNPDVVRGVSNIYFVVNSEDFDQASSWACDLTHPRARPFFALIYLFKKYVVKPVDCGVTPPELQVARGDWRKELRGFMGSALAKDKSVTFWLYPNQQEAVDVGLLEARLEVREKEILKLLEGHNVRVFSLARDPRWREVDYVDVIHPGARGIEVMADVMSDARYK